MLRIYNQTLYTIFRFCSTVFCLDVTKYRINFSILAIVMSNEPIDTVPEAIIVLNMPLISEFDGPSKSFEPS